MTTTIAREPVATLFAPGVKALLEQHWREIALYQDEVKLEPDFARYVALEKSGHLVVIVARDGLRVVGYSVFLVSNHLHYSSCKMANNDVLFVDKDYRKGTSLGIRLIRCSEVILQGLGVQRVTWHVKPLNDWSPVLARMGYAQEEIIMGKLLETNHGY